MYRLWLMLFSIVREKTIFLVSKHCLRLELCSLTFLGWKREKEIKRKRENEKENHIQVRLNIEAFK